jgi:hypothetical protein
VVVGAAAAHLALLPLLASQAPEPTPGTLGHASTAVHAEPRRVWRVVLAGALREEGVGQDAS